MKFIQICNQRTVVAGGNKMPFDKPLNFTITRLIFNDPVPCEHAPGIDIYDKHWFLSGIEQDAISGFRAYPWQLQQFRSQLSHREAEELIQRSSVLGVKIGYKRLQIGGFLPIKAGWSHQLLQIR